MRENDHPTPSDEPPKPSGRFPFRRARALVFASVVALVAAGLVFRTGTGTPSSFGIDAVAALCPLGALETMIGSKEVVLHPVLLLAGMALAVALVGKAFCAWMCPAPWLERLIRPKKKVLRDDACKREGETGREGCHGCTTCVLQPVGGKRDGVRFDTRHASLLGALGATAVFGFPVFCLVCPIGLTFATFIGLWHLLRFNETSWGLLIFPAILLVEVVFLRKWCAKICPVSALVSLLAVANRTLRPRVRREACLRTSGIDCRACVEACPEQVDPHSARIPECSKCGACVEACPANAISIKVREKTSGRSMP
ncbi:4Fe-4S binding protein [Arabiibacter massiliensis]|uniref:4Fe-4S binding protein n=1 Tax=Arabiibacter massiliensis TaxID=1870985 RepID=UPI0009B97658|nr:4Fe-4S binding protein [Arabiibacter massiliensis]